MNQYIKQQKAENWLLINNEKENVCETDSENITVKDDQAKKQAMILQAKKSN